MFAVNSRYHHLGTAQFVMPDGREVKYVKRRFVPRPQRGAGRFEHVVLDDERLDNITARYLGDPEQFWRLCDANRAMRAEELTAVPGQRILIPTTPEV